mgnify:FL=1
MPANKKIENEFIEIKQLENKDFLIPSYQRGYRWDNKEVKELLEDVNDFMLTKKYNDFYCLQPIVVKEDKSKYRTIDGQQRLTTIFLIIKYLKDKDYFKIEYETREKSFDFLNKIKDKDDNSADNIDFYYFLEAYKCIKDFFENNQNINKNEFYDTLVNNCKVLWYEISDNESEQDVFIRLNIGKIPLLEGENIKALFLSKNEEIDDSDLEDRAKTWYEAEKILRANNDFSYLVLSKINKEYIEKDYDNNNILNDDFLRIGVYLDAIKENEKQGLFDYFYNLKKNNKLNDEWNKLEECINTLSKFASDDNGNSIERNIFHYIGFLILNDVMNINSIYKLWNETTQNNLFLNKLLEEINNNITLLVNGKDILDYIDNLNFKDHKKIIFKILVLFNIDRLLKDKGSIEYFKFNRFQLEEWSLEHIYAQNSKSIKEYIDKNSKEEIIKWLEEVIKYIEDTSLTKEIENAINKLNVKSINNIDNFNNLLDNIDNNFKYTNSLNGIGNLCLLDKVSNSRIGNNIFSIKRKDIEELGNKGKLIPIATKEVFNKQFSKRNKNKDLFTKEDREDYMNDIIEVLKNYIK